MSLRFSGPPPPDIVAPTAVERLRRGGTLRPVWANELGGLTFALTHGTETTFVKWAPAGSGVDLSDEVARLDWAAPFVVVPHVVDQGADDEGGWFATAALPGENAVTARWKAEPDIAVAAIGRGLRAFHDALPVDGCPFSWSVADRLASVDERLAADAIDPRRWHADHRSLDLDRARDRLTDAPDVDHVVVGHGDACAPNTLIAADGTWSGHVDLGSLGVADRWADLAIATWSTMWNYGPGMEEPLLDAYGVDPDPERTAYYRLLWDLGP